MLLTKWHVADFEGDSCVKQKSKSVKCYHCYPETWWNRNSGIVGVADFIQRTVGAIKWLIHNHTGCHHVLVDSYLLRIRN